MVAVGHLYYFTVLEINEAKAGRRVVCACVLLCVVSWKKKTRSDDTWCSTTSTCIVYPPGASIREKKHDAPPGAPVDDNDVDAVDASTPREIVVNLLSSAAVVSPVVASAAAMAECGEAEAASSSPESPSAAVAVKHEYLFHSPCSSMPQGKDLILIGSANPNVTSSIHIPILFKALLNSTPVPSNYLFTKILAYYSDSRKATLFSVCSKIQLVVCGVFISDEVARAHGFHLRAHVGDLQFHLSAHCVEA